MTISRDELEASLARACADVTDPRAGIYGPDSMSWAVGREAVLFIGGGCAMLMQLAHPFVAHAINQRSYARKDPLRRFQRTFARVSAMAFGDLDQVLEASRRVHAVHARVSGTITEDAGRFAAGTTYEANHEEALLWVYATLIDTIVRVHELVVRPLSNDEKERLYAEKRRFALLFGIRNETMPPDWPSFEAYVARMLASDTLSVGAPARAVAEAILVASRPAYAPAFRWYRALTAGLLPDRLRSEFDLRYGRPERLVFRASIASLRECRPFLPSRVRLHPAYRAANRRLKRRAPPSSRRERG